MSPVALARELTEENLTEALSDARTVGNPEQLVLVVGGRAKLRAARIVGSWGGPLYQVVPVSFDPKADPDHWSLIRVARRRPYKRRQP